MTHIVYNESCIGKSALGYEGMICDPPYAAHVHENTTSQSKVRGTRHNDLGFDSLSDELRDQIAKFTNEVKKWSLIYSDVEGLSNWKTACESLGGTYIRPMAWVRWSMPQLSGDRAPQGFELVTSYWGNQKGRKHWSGPGNLTHLSHKCLRGEGKHKTEKPLDQLLDLVNWFTDPGDKILDPCAGSGTTGLACKILGREFVGYEINKEWTDKANDRINKCNIDLDGKVSGLSDRDQERYNRWLVTNEELRKDKERIRKHTDKVRETLDKSRKEKITLELDPYRCKVCFSVFHAIGDNGSNYCICCDKVYTCL